MEELPDPKDEEEPQYEYYDGRPVFKTKEDIPVDYLNFLKDYFNIKEDPLKEKEKYMAQFYDDFYDTDTVMNVEENNTTDIKEENNETISSKEGCKECDARGKDREYRLMTIKNTILQRLGFDGSNLPNMTSFPKVPSIQKLIEQYDMQGDAPYGTTEDDYEDDFYGQIQRAFTIAQLPPKEFDIDISGGTYFDLPESVKSRKVQEAVLWIYLEPPKGKAKKKKQVIEIYYHIVPAKAKAAQTLKGPVHYKKTTSYGWQEFKATHIVHHWIRRPETNRGVIIRAIDQDGNNIAVSPDKYEHDKLNPMLEMTTVEDKKHRKKRSVYPNICSESQKIESCCRYPLRVDFVQFGWDWVIAPTGYMSNYCSGECVHRHMDNTPQSYLMQQTPNGSGPCCTPSKMYPLAMLYFDHEHTVLYTYMQKMIVEKCACA